MDYSAIAAPISPLTQHRRQNIALAFSLAIHLALLVLLFFYNADRVSLRPDRGLSVLDTVSLSDTKAQPAQEAEEPEVDVTTRPGETLFPVELPMLTQVATSSGPEGQACAIAAAIQADLLLDEPARAEIAAIPFDARSVANAIVLWVGTPEHVRPNLPATDALILKRLLSVPEQCLDLDQPGPDFIYAMVDNRTISIAVGSGQWRWRTYFDLLSAPMHPMSPAERISSAPGY